MLRIGVVRGACCASALLVVLLVTSCGGADGSGAGASISPTRTPTATLPSPELPSPTRSRTRSPDPTESTQSAQPTSTQPTEQEPTPEPTEQQPTSETPASTPEQTEEAGEEPADEPNDSAEESAEDSAVPSWAWWVLAALVLGSVVAIPLLVAARRRQAWRQQLVEAEGEIAWFARELLPGLRQTGSIEQVSGGWAVGQARVAAAEDRLTVLESSAPDEAGGQRARSLRDAVRRARVRMEQLTRAGQSDTWALDLDAITADLEAVLRPSPVAPPG